MTDYLDDDGYPTEEALAVIEGYDFLALGLNGLLELVQALWHWPDGYIREGERLTLITGGWSGNESIIGALRDNQHLFWPVCWVSSNRGGRHEFEVPERFWKAEAQR